MGKDARSWDPATSLPWVLLPLILGVVGVMISSLTNWGVIGITVGGLLGALVGVLIERLTPLKDWLSARAMRKRAAKEAGYGGTAWDRTLEQLGVHPSRPDLDNTEFAPRDMYPRVCAALTSSGPVLVEGPPFAGKSRLIIEAIREVLPDAQLWYTEHEDAITTLQDSRQYPDKGSVIFLDNVDRFIANHSLTANRLDSWLDSDCRVIATITPSKYAEWPDAMAHHVPGSEVMNRFTTPIHLDTLPTETEIEAMRHTGYADMIDDSRRLGFPSIMGGAHLAKNKFATGREIRSWGWALVRAAADLRRVGLGPASKEQIEKLALSYACIPLTDPAWPDAWSWATDPISETLALIQRVAKDRWEVLDLIADAADWSLLRETLEAMDTLGLNAAQCLALGAQAYREANYNGDDWIRSLIDRAVDSDARDVYVSATLISKLLDNEPKPGNAPGMVDEALGITPVKLSLRAEFTQYRNVLGTTLDEVHLHASHREWHGNSIENDLTEALIDRSLKMNPQDANNLGGYALFLHQQGRDPDEVDTAYHHAIDADPHHADNLGNYALFLHQQGRDPDEIDTAYHHAIDADPHHADNLGNYAVFLHQQGRDPDEIDTAYHHAIDADPHHARNLGNYALFLH
ncbi:MAG: hypothetical protein FWD75_09540, partial [Propionibacteriaceae bacterium]|nr:hypothetical protein [Propionibacteriaceae bacterium]